MKILYFILSFILIFSLFSFPVFAASYQAWGSVLDSTSQAQQLIQYYLQDASPLYDFIVIRTGEFQYRLFYAKDLLNDSIVNYISLDRYTLGNYNYEWRFSTGSDTSFSYNLGNYTAVGNISGSKILYSDTFDQFKTRFILRYILIAFVVMFGFCSFRIHMGKKREVHL